MVAWGAFLFRVVVALWVGGMAFFTFLTTPTLFRRYGRDHAGEVVGRLIGGYFLYNLALSIIATVLVLLWWGGMGGFSRWLSLLLLLAAVAANLYVAFLLHPRIESVKKEVASFESNAESLARRRFRELHRESTALNLAVLAVGVLLLALEPLLRG